MKIPFNNFKNDVKPIISGLEVSNDLENVRSSFEIGAEILQSVISSDMYDLMIAHYQSDKYLDTAYEILNELVQLSRYPIANFGMYKQIPFAAVNITNDGITRTESTDRKSAYRYQVEEIKVSLLEIAWKKTNELIIFMQKNKANVFLWKPNTVVTTGQKFYVLEKSNYYQANTDFTTAESFDDDILNWDILDKTVDVQFWQWIESEQYTSYTSSLFVDDRDFGKYIGTKEEPAFYISCQFIISELMRTEIQPRLDINAIIERIEYNSQTDEDKLIISNLKPFIAKKALAQAIITFDYYRIPSMYRQQISNEFVSSSFQTTQDTIRNDIGLIKSEDADKELIRFDTFLKSLKAKKENRKITVIPDINTNSKYWTP